MESKILHRRKENQKLFENTLNTISERVESHLKTMKGENQQNEMEQIEQI